MSGFGRCSSFISVCFGEFIQGNVEFEDIHARLSPDIEEGLPGIDRDKMFDCTRCKAACGGDTSYLQQSRFGTDVRIQTACRGRYEISRNGCIRSQTVLGTNLGNSFYDSLLKVST